MAIAFLAAPATSAAQVIVCTEPVEPVCIGMKQTFTDDALVLRCGRDVKSYLEEMREFAACLRQKASETEKQAQALEKKFQSDTKQASDSPAAGAASDSAVPPPKD